ncbi:MAG TPA: sulfurtransferase-like selenium metabolism protein YedF [Bacillota bacterium]|nr:sulfurtransferase-like selenium metabolism protein YedF [Bacillota bacterium]
MNRVNAIGDACPLPVIKTKKALEAMTSGVIEVTVDNDTAVQNITRFAAARNYPVKTEKRGDHFVLLIEKADTEEQTTTREAPESAQKGCAGEAKGSFVVAVTSDKMGSGDEALGAILIKSFFFTLTQLDDLPDVILFYNGGVKLSVHGSPVLTDLNALEKAGVRLMSCGTCLNHFDLKEQLAAGEVTNMYDIVDQLRTAARVIRP